MLFNLLLCRCYGLKFGQTTWFWTFNLLNSLPNGIHSHLCLALLLRFRIWLIWLLLHCRWFNWAWFHRFWLWRFFFDSLNFLLFRLLNFFIFFLFFLSFLFFLGSSSSWFRLWLTLFTHSWFWFGSRSRYRNRSRRSFFFFYGRLYFFLWSSDCGSRIWLLLLICSIYILLCCLLSWCCCCCYIRSLSWDRFRRRVACHVRSLSWRWGLIIIRCTFADWFSSLLIQVMINFACFCKFSAQL